MKSQFLFSTASLLFDLLLLRKKKKKKENPKEKKVGVSWFPSKCKLTPAPVFTRWSADPRSASHATVAGRCFEPRFLSRCVNTHERTLTHTKRNRSGYFLLNTVVRGLMLNNGSVFLLSSTRKSKPRQKGRAGRGAADLMRGTLSSVQHRSGPLCRNSSSSHDWLYNLQRQTCDTLSHESQQDFWLFQPRPAPLSLESSSNGSLLQHQVLMPACTITSDYGDRGCGPQLRRG